jgi:hypothetical protein
MRGLVAPVSGDDVDEPLVGVRFSGARSRGSSVARDEVWRWTHV